MNYDDYLQLKPLLDCQKPLTKEHDVLMLDNAEEAYRLIDEGEQFDVILCDLLMPQMSGMDFHRALARAYPDGDAGARQALGDHIADPPGAAGDQRGLSGNIEEFANIHDYRPIL